MTLLSGRNALVTGGGSGIGRAVALDLAASGVIVTICGRRREPLHETVQTIVAAGGHADAIVCDLTDSDAIERLAENLLEINGGVDILVNNAAANPYFGPVEDTDLGAFNKTVDVNIRGYFFMCARGAQMMKKAGGGSIVNVASVNGVNPGHYQGIYSVTKAAVISMTKSFAMELGQQKIRVNALLPGLTDTKFASALTTNEAIKKQAMAHIPMKRVADPGEMAGTVLYLVSDASSYTTGACINADGGYLTV